MFWKKKKKSGQSKGVEPKHGQEPSVSDKRRKQKKSWLNFLIGGEFVDGTGSVCLYTVKQLAGLVTVRLLCLRKVKTGHEFH